jgi:elongation factor Ts
MANVTAADVKRLREQTGAGILDCKNALEATGGDIEAAIEELRKKGLRDMSKRAGRTAANGLVAVVLNGTESGMMFELNCETDFVAKTELFGQLAANISVAAKAAQPVDRDALLAAKAVSEPGKTVQDLISEAAVSLKENLELGRFARFDGGYIASYLHKTDPSLPPSKGALVQFDTDGGEVTKEIAQQIVALRPKYLRREDVPADVIERERRIAEQITRDEGKPEQIIPKIVDGRLNRFFADSGGVLVEQAFIKEPKKTVQQVLDENGVAVRGFAHFQVGQA